MRLHGSSSKSMQPWGGGRGLDRALSMAPHKVIIEVIRTACVARRRGAFPQGRNGRRSPAPAQAAGSSCAAAQRESLLPSRTARCSVATLIRSLRDGRRRLRG